MFAQFNFNLSMVDAYESALPQVHPLRSVEKQGGVEELVKRLRRRFTPYLSPLSLHCLCPVHPLGSLEMLAVEKQLKGKDKRKKKQVYNDTAIEFLRMKLP